MEEGAGPGPSGLECGASFLGLSPLCLEACAQVALNVDFGRARGPECQGGLLGGTHGTAVSLPATGPAPSIRE